MYSRQPGKQTAKEAKEKKKEMMVDKKNLEQAGEGMEKQMNWMAEHSGNLSPCQTNQNSKEKYENTCLVSECHQINDYRKSLRNK